MHKKLLSTFIFVFTVGLFFQPFLASAASIYIKQPVDRIKTGEEFVLKVYIDTASKEINALEGSIKIDGDLQINSIDTKNSIFNLWPEEPKISNQEIYFAGGTPGGVFGKDLRVFDIFLTSKSIGQISFSGDNIKAYLNDGNGTNFLVNPISSKIKINLEVRKSNSLFWAIIILFFVYYFYRFFKKRKNEK